MELKKKFKKIGFIFGLKREMKLFSHKNNNIVSVCGYGKNSKNATKELIKFGVDIVINFGFAGSISKSLKNGDIVFIDKLFNEKKEKLSTLKLDKDLLRNLQNNFKYQIVDTYDIINHIENYIEYDLTYFFKQYLFNPLIPTFQYYISKEKNNFYLNYKWDAIENFDMPILISQSKEDSTWIYPKNNWKKKQLTIDKKSDFVVLKDLFLVNIKKSK